MFGERTLADPVAEVRATHAPEALVLDCERNFETLPPEQAEELGLVVDSLAPASAPAEWLPPDAPEVLKRYAGDAFTVGAPGDGSVVWTRQTDPPVVLCKPILADSPAEFALFLVAEALVELSLAGEEHFLGFFGERYPDFAAAASPLGPVGTYQLAAACHDAHVGLTTRNVFADFDGPLFDAWLDTGDRLEKRLDQLPEALARGQIAFGDAAELACSGVKHALELPAPFDALDAGVYQSSGADYAVEWADRAVEATV
jgi:hypothetical protein